MEKGRKRDVSKILICTACPKGSDAEQLHPDLRVPICGACVASLKDADQHLLDNQKQYCAWCGAADDVNLMFCDTCPRAFCYECIQRNFGKTEADYIRALDVWSCYVCHVTPSLKRIQVNENIEYFNIERAYAAVHPPNIKVLRRSTENATVSLTPEERGFIALFRNSIKTVTIQDSELIAKYLTAADLSVMLCLSKGLRKLFQTEIFVVPGLFKTEYGLENACRLYDHQVVSLNRMTQIENSSSEFGALRGGIFGDEPGLGKTVTSLALVATTAGVVPQQPAAFWNQATIEEHWRAKRGQFGIFLGPVLNHLQKCPEMGRFQSEGIRELRADIERSCGTIAGFEAKVRAIIRAEVNVVHERNKVLDVFRQEMHQVREGLDPTLRKTLTNASPAQQRMRHERSLCPSGATLIVVPLALLEHWYEQIARHLNLSYFTADEEQRGVVYLDGLGDIVDVEAPLSKLKVDTGKPMVSAHFLSHYMIVVTTFERCAADAKVCAEYGHSSQPAPNAAGSSSLLQLRWLRLLIDEGHEIGKSDSSPFAMRVTKFISQIAAERRWCMSGTPTTGANSKLALAQICRIFQFLRHPRIAATATNNKLSAADKSAPGDASASVGPLGHSNDGFIGLRAWEKSIIAPCLAQEKEAWSEVTQLLRNVLLRHTKADIKLFEPIRSNINLELEGGAQILRHLDPEERARTIDRCKAEYIAQTITAARREWRQFYRQSGVSSANDARRRSVLFRLQSHALEGSDSGVTDRESPLDETDYWPGIKEEVKVKAEPALGALFAADMLAMTRDEQELFIKGRCPKAIVFSQHHWDLEGVGHHLILLMGASAVCEHSGEYRSSELSRFRHSKRKYRRCPMCGHCNQITTGTCCLNALLAVEYHNPPELPEGMTTPQPGGHGRHNPGGHFSGRCLCSPAGCPRPEGWKENKARGAVWCDGLPNPFFGEQEFQNQNIAIVSLEHIDGYIPGVNFVVGQPVVVRKQEACLDPEGAPLEPVVMEDSDVDAAPAAGGGPGTVMGPSQAALWRGGVLGGHAIVRGWRSCGGKGANPGWHGSKVLANVPWTVEAEEASVLMLKEDGSTGLDLSFATHIFLLDPIKDPALRNQIISRAHRMGATGPVQVQLVQVSVEDDD